MRPIETLDDRLIVLRFIYGWARMWTQLETVATEGVDAGMIHSKFQAAKDALKNFTAIKRQCATIVEVAGEIERIGDEIKQALDDQVRAIEAELRKDST